MYQECYFGDVCSYRESMDSFLPNLEDFYRHPRKYAEEPFRIYGNLYYVGDRKVCMHLVDTGEGLLLFDTGYSHTYEMLLDSIRALGYDPGEIRVIIHSHGHFDHFGCGDRLRELSGAKVYMSRVDTDYIKEDPSRALCHLGPTEGETICRPDETIEDGDVISLGNTQVRCIAAPGHTYGTMAYFFEAEENGVRKKAGYFGGTGFLTMSNAYCREYGLPEGKVEVMGKTLRKLRDLPVDIVLGNHPNQNGTLEKRAYWKAHPERNPFINPAAWNGILDTIEARRQEYIAKGFAE